MNALRLSPHLTRSVLALTVFSAVASAQSERLAPETMKLSAPLPIEVRGSVFEYAVAPDGGRVVYLADQEVDEVGEIFSAPADGNGAPVKLNGPIVPGGGVSAFTFTPDGTHVVYRASETSLAVDLHLVPVDGSAPPVQLTSGQLVGFSFEVTPDGGSVVYLDSGLIKKAPLDGSGVVTVLSDPTFFSGFITGITADSTRVVYAVHCCADDGQYSSLLTETGISTQVTTNVGAGDVVWSFPALAGPGNEYLVYRADLGPDPARLFSAPVDASAPPTLLNGPMDTTREVLDFRVAPDGNHVVYVSDEDEDDKYELSGVLPDGSAAPIRISGDLPAFGDVWHLGPLRFEITPDSSKVVYAADAETDSVLDLFVVPIDVEAPPATKLSPPLQLDGDVIRMSLSGDSQWVAFLADAEVDGRSDLFAAPFDGSSPPVRLDTHAFGADNDVSDFIAAPSGDRVLYKIDDSAWRLYSAVRDAGEPPVQLGDDVTDGSFFSMAFSPDGGRAYYRSNGGPRNAFKLFTAPADGTANPERLNSQLPFAIVGDVVQFEVDPTGTYAVYRADQVADEIVELFSVPLDGSAAPVRLNAPLPFESTAVDSFQLTDDGFVIYRANQDVVTRDELYRVPIDGSQAPVRLSDPMPPNGTVLSYSIEGDWVVYVADGIVRDRYDLFSVPADGSSGAVRLNTLTLSGGDVTEVQVDGAHTRVAYVADHVTDNQHEVFSAPIDGSQPAIKLNEALLQADGDVVELLITPDGAHVIFRAYRNGDQDIELFAVPITGGQAPVRLHPPLADGGDVWEFEGDVGGRVVFIAEAFVDNQDELFSVFPDGTGFVRINPALSPFGDIMDFTLGAGGDVIYRADQTTNGKNELYVGPVDGSKAPYVVSAPLASFADVLHYTLDPTKTRIVYTADAGTDGDYDLFGVPVDGSLAAVRLNPPLVAGGDVTLPTEITAGGRVVYRADQEVDNQWNLYSVPILGGPVYQVNPLLPPNGDTSIHQRVVGDQVLYAAGQDEAFVAELYVTIDHAAQQQQP